MGFVADYMMKRANLGDIMAGNRGETAPEKPKSSGKLGLK